MHASLQACAPPQPPCFTSENVCCSDTTRIQTCFTQPPSMHFSSCAAQTNTWVPCCSRNHSSRSCSADDRTSSAPTSDGILSASASNKDELASSLPNARQAPSRPPPTVTSCRGTIHSSGPVNASVPNNCRAAVARNTGAKPCRSTRNPPSSALPDQPNAVILSTLLQRPRIACKYEAPRKSK